SGSDLNLGESFDLFIVTNLSDWGYYLNCRSMDGLIDGLHGEEIHERLSRKKFMPVQILTDITVIECATFVTGPYATALLACLSVRSERVLCLVAGRRYAGTGDQWFVGFAERVRWPEGNGNGGVGLRHRALCRIWDSRRAHGAREVR